MIIDHVGVVTKSMEQGIKLWTEKFGYRQKTNLVLNSRQQVNVIFLEKSGSIDIKLIEPADETSPVYRFARQGGGLHHLCFKCEILTTQLLALQEMGLRVISGPEPGEAFENENIAFVYATQGLNIELIDTDKRAGRIGDCEL